MKLGAKPHMALDETSHTGMGVPGVVLAKGGDIANTLTQNTFGLWEKEKSSIEADINAKKPIGDTPAYRKFLAAIFPEKEITFPYLADYDDALVVVSKLSEFFCKTVRLPNKDEAIQSLKDNNYFTGFRGASFGAVGGVGDYGYAWLSGETRGEGAPCVWHYRNGHSGSGINYRRGGRSVIPVFG